MTIRNKAGLKAEIQARFPNNTSQLITPDDLRSYLNDQVESSLAFKTEVVTGTPFSVADDTDLVLANPGASDIHLPAIANFKSRAITIFNNSGGPVTFAAAGGDTIGGSPTSVGADDFGAIIAPNGTNWVSIIDSSRFQLSRLLDVLLSSPQVGDRLDYDGSFWRNVPRKQTANFFEEDASSVTTINAANTFVDINNTLTKDADGYNPDLTVSGATVTWGATRTATFMGVFNVSSETVGSNNQKYQFRLIKNGVTAIDGKCEINASNIRADHGCICFMVELSENDTVNPQVAAIGHTTDIENEEITLCLMEME